MRSYFYLFTTTIVFFACQPQEKGAENGTAATTKQDSVMEENPAAEGFNMQESDKKAILLADEVIKAMGGRHAWDKTRYIHWNFFGARNLLWDKQTGNVRIESPRDSSVYLVNIQDNTGRVICKGQEITQPDSLRKYLQKGKSIWINDSYWLFMPFKLKDSGVTLKYVGTDTTQAGKSAELLQLTFQKVGDTPENKYYIWIDNDDKLVKQWAYFEQAAADSPNFITPWTNYNTYGKILLASDRGERDITEIKILEEVPQEAFTEFEYKMNK